MTPFGLPPAVSLRSVPPLPRRHRIVAVMVRFVVRLTLFFDERATNLLVELGLYFPSSA